MKIKQNISKLSIAIILLTSALTMSCNSDNSSEELAREVYLEGLRADGTTIEKVTITNDHIRLIAGETHQLTAIGTDSNGYTGDINNDDFTWSSNDKTIATVNSSGLVTAVASSLVNQGIVTITVTTEYDIYDEGEISVSDSPATAIILKQTTPDSGNINTCINANIKGDVTYEDDYKSLSTINAISFSINGDTAATIDDNGVLYTSSSESEDIFIIAKIGDVSGELTVTADPINLDTLDTLLDEVLVGNNTDNLITLNIGDSIQVNAQANLVNNTSVYNIDNTIFWSQIGSDNVGITTEGENKGTIVALKPGDTQLIGSCGGKQTISTLRVEGDADLDTIQINDGSSSYSVEPLEFIELTLTANYTTTPSLNVTEFAVWDTNDSAIISIELIDAGTDTATYKLTSDSSSTGTAIISVTYDGITRSAIINIEETS